MSIYVHVDNQLARLAKKKSDLVRRKADKIRKSDPNGERFYGTTAEQMNFSAKFGTVTEADLLVWAESQNKNCFSIEWYVKSIEINVAPNFSVQGFRLDSRSID